MPVHGFGQFLVTRDRFRTTERDLDAHCPETGANLIIDAEKAAHVEVALDLDLHCFQFNPEMRRPEPGR